jgi:hypothetical protein
VIEEGVGFGAPVVVYQERPFFSSSAETSFHQETNCSKLTKSFTIDTVSRKKFRGRLYLNDSIYLFMQRQFHYVYTLNKKLSSGLTPIVELVKTAGIDTDFQKVNPRGSVTVEYTCFPHLIEVNVRLTELNKQGCNEILILNEQGASFFRKYSDTNGVTLHDDQIGPWEPTEAKEVSLFNVGKTMGFSLKSKAEAKLFRGREKIRNRYSWVGFCYVLSPNIESFRYTVKLITNGEGNQPAMNNLDGLSHEHPAQKINP